MSIERRLADAIGMGTCATPHAVLGWTPFEQLAWISTEANRPNVKIA
jgi:hypothetical protein